MGYLTHWLAVTNSHRRYAFSYLLVLKKTWVFTIILLVIIVSPKHVIQIWLNSPFIDIAVFLTYHISHTHWDQLLLFNPLDYIQVTIQYSQVQDIVTTLGQKENET